MGLDDDDLRILLEFRSSVGRVPAKHCAIFHVAVKLFQTIIHPPLPLCVLFLQRLRSSSFRCLICWEWLITHLLSCLTCASVSKEIAPMGKIPNLRPRVMMATRPTFMTVTLSVYSSLLDSGRVRTFNHCDVLECGGELRIDESWRCSKCVCEIMCQDASADKAWRGCRRSKAFHIRLTTAAGDVDGQ